MVARRRRADRPSTELLTDAEVLGRVLRGETDRFGVLVRRYQRQLSTYARSMGISSDPADDLVQDAFIRAFNSLAECRRPERFRMWLFRILRNRCLDYLKNVRRSELRLEDVSDRPDADDPIGAADRAEAGRRVKEALDRLPLDLREAFVLKHVDGRTYEEMAEITGASVSALKMRVYRAREILKEALAPFATEALV